MSGDYESDGNASMLLVVVRVVVVAACVAGGTWMGYRAGVEVGVNSAPSTVCPPAEPCPEAPPCPEPAATPAPQVCRWNAADVRHVYRRGWETGYGTGREDWRCLPWEPR